MLQDRVLFIDGEAILLDKPAGLPVDRPRAGGDSIEALAPLLSFGFARPPAAVHRLDRDTSGCLLLARNPKAHRRFAATFEAGDVQKTYLAVLAGIPADQSGTVDMALSKRSSAAQGWRMIADRKGKAAVTEWKVLGTIEGRALVAFTPRTGRTHQIRVHAASGIGHAIVGDPVYGTADRFMLLHAARLVMPRDAKPDIVGCAPLPETFGPFRAFVPPSDQVKIA